MNILTFNCGSSSQGFKVYQTSKNAFPNTIASGKAFHVATNTQAQATIHWEIHNQAGSKTTDLSTHRLAAHHILSLLKDHKIHIDAIGHRFVHGGNLFHQTTRINHEALDKLRLCFPYAPIHNPNAYSVIEVCQQNLPALPQVVVFDTSFHSHLPEVSKQYAIPSDLAQTAGFYKVGFHGLSCQYISTKAAELTNLPLETLKLIICHLGTGGSSITAVKDGKSLDTSMGYSPLPGLVMSTRSGDLDPEIVLELVRREGSTDKVSELLNTQSGLIGLSGFSSNLEEIIEESEKGNSQCNLAYAVYAHRLKIFLGAYSWLLNGADMIIFTDDIGTKSWKLRDKVCSEVENLGIEIDKSKNRNAPPNQATLVSSSASKTQIWVIPTDEEIVIYHEVMNKLA